MLAKGYLNGYPPEGLAVRSDVQEHDGVLGGTGGEERRGEDARLAVSQAVPHL